LAEYREYRDMDAIQIMKKEETPDGWRFVVEIGPDHNKIGFSILICKDYWIALTDGKYPPEELLVRSLRFLLQQEPKTSITRSFHLKDIQKRFSGFEEHIRALSSESSSYLSFFPWHSTSS
jgi:hypothetical protein